MAKILNLKTDYVPNSETNSKNGNTLNKDNLKRNQNAETLFLREGNKTKI